MPFEFRRRIQKLGDFYGSMRAQHIDVGTFEHTYNGVNSHAILDTTGTEWRLIFIKDVIGDVLSVPILRGYVFAIIGDDAYWEFVRYFNINGTRGNFHIGDFIDNLITQIPSNYVLNDNRRETVNTYTNYDRNEPGIYPIGTINWQLQHVKHPEWPKDKYHRSDDNLRKTKQLYPNIYEATKDLDITIRYGQNSGQNTPNMVANHYDWKN